LCFIGPWILSGEGATDPSLLNAPVSCPLRGRFISISSSPISKEDGTYGVLMRPVGSVSQCTVATAFTFKGWGVYIG